MPHLDYDQRLDWVLTPVRPDQVRGVSGMRLLFLGDVVGRSGRQAVIEQLPKLRARYKLDFVAVNGENAAGGFGITEAILEELLDAGADVVTLGNHAFDQKEALVFIERQPRLLRPINYPPGTPGRGSGIFKARQRRRRAGDQRHGPDLHAGAGRPVPRRRRARSTACGLKQGADAILIDFHAEATSEKQALRLFRRRARQPAWSARTRMRPRRTSACCRAARPS